MHLEGIIKNIEKNVYIMNNINDKIYNKDKSLRG